MSQKNSSDNQANNFDLDRFKTAQDNVYAVVTGELKSGKKQSHWMWFIFPQIAGLGSSGTSRHYAIKSIEEARAYLNDPVLGTRLRECSAILMDIQHKSANAIFGYPDNLKLHSSITLFSIVAPEELLFGQVLARYFNNNRDQQTVDIVNSLKS